MYFLLAFSCWYKAFIYSGSQQNRWNEQPTLAANMQDCVVFFMIVDICNLDASDEVFAKDTWYAEKR